MVKDIYPVNLMIRRKPSSGKVLTMDYFKPFFEDIQGQIPIYTSTGTETSMFVPVTMLEFARIDDTEGKQRETGIVNEVRIQTNPSRTIDFFEDGFYFSYNAPQNWALNDGYFIISGNGNSYQRGRWTYNTLYYDNENKVVSNFSYENVANTKLEYNIFKTYENLAKTIQPTYHFLEFLERYDRFNNPKFFNLYTDSGLDGFWRLQGTPALRSLLGDSTTFSFRFLIQGIIG